MQKDEVIFASAKTRKIIAMVFMIVMMVMSLIAFIGGVVETSIFSGVDGETSSEMVSEGTAITIILFSMADILWFVAFVGFVITFLMWLNRSYKNLLALSVQGLQHTPGWAVGWYFIPVANLFKPYIVMKEMYLATMHHNGTTSWKRKGAPKFLLIWWLLYLFGNALSGQGAGATFDTIRDYQVSAMSTMISEPLLIVSGIMLLVLMKQITTKQDNLAQQ